MVAVAHKGQAPLSQVAKDFGISESCLHLLEQENEVLCRAAAFFAREISPK